MTRRNLRIKLITYTTNANHVARENAIFERL